ncbi:MAG: 2-oxo-4-hydroxy-4-carboxy-5-ureidoimidazoline decarboxylase [Candidatus Sericytochromatia bacterium]
MTLDELNNLPEPDAIDAFTRCCGAHRWVNKMVHKRPFRDREDLLAAADEVWERLGREDYLEAFSHHPKIGDMDALRKKFASTATWASGEQSGTAAASEETLRGLAEGNEAYERKNGFIFIICATGKSAAEMLEALNQRLDNPPETELVIASQQQAMITRLRLEKLLTP